MVDLTLQPFAILFPGQGVQFPGMIHRLKNSAVAQEVLSAGEKILGYPIVSMMQAGRADALNPTIYAQPAVFLASLAYLKAFQEFTDQNELPSVPLLYCGHSLGEVTALVAAGSIDFESGVKFVAARAQVMDQASRDRPGLLAAVLGLGLEQVREIVQQSQSHGLLVIANYNGPGQYILSGQAPAIHRACELAEKAGATKTVVLRITTPSHSPLMEDAQVSLCHELESLNIKDAQVPVILNTTAELTTSAQVIRKELQNHLCQAVQWEKTLNHAYTEGNVSLFLDMGPGAIFEKMIQYQLPNAQAVSLGFMQPFERLLRVSSGKSSQEARG